MSIETDSQHKSRRSQLIEYRRAERVEVHLHQNSPMTVLRNLVSQGGNSLLNAKTQHGVVTTIHDKITIYVSTLSKYFCQSMLPR